MSEDLITNHNLKKKTKDDIQIRHPFPELQSQECQTEKRKDFERGKVRFRKSGLFWANIAKIDADHQKR